MRMKFFIIYIAAISKFLFSRYNSTGIFFRDSLFIVMNRKRIQIRRILLRKSNGNNTILIIIDLSIIIREDQERNSATVIRNISKSIVSYHPRICKILSTLELMALSNVNCILCVVFKT